MRIVLAAWHLRDFNVGLGRYCRGLIDAIGRVDRQNYYEILMPDDSCRFPDRPNVQMAPLLAGPHDLLHFPHDSCVAWKRARLVTTVHDVKPLLFPVLVSRPSLHSVIEKALIRDKWARIDHIITDSECSRRDIVRHMPVPNDRLTVVYPGIDLDRFRPVDTDQVKAEGKKSAGSPAPSSTLTSVSRPYVLSVAGADPTKNVETLVDAFAKLPAELCDRHDLILVGDFRKRPELRERAARLGIEKQTVFPGVVNDDRLIELYQHAAVFVFPSRYEGFGLPVLEAMACGCSVVSSNASSLPEVAGDAAILVEPTDADGLAGAMTRVLSEPELRRDLRRRGPARAAQFSWDRTARETIAVYKKVTEEKG